MWSKVLICKVGLVDGAFVPRFVHPVLRNCKKGNFVKLIRQLAILLLAASAAFGQTALGTVTGTTTDPAGAVVPNAPVSLKNTETGRVYAAVSSDTGNYTVTQLPIGAYDLTVAAPGFRTYEHSNFHVSAGQTLREDVSLQVGQASESVTVSADASRLQTGIQYSDSGAFSAVVSAVVNGTPSNTLWTRLDGATMNPTSSRLLGDRETAIHAGIGCTVFNRAPILTRT
jgi:hypothetical protein